MKNEKKLNQLEKELKALEKGFNLKLIKETDYQNQKEELRTGIAKILYAYYKLELKRIETHLRAAKFYKDYFLKNGLKILLENRATKKAKKDLDSLVKSPANMERQLKKSRTEVLRKMTFWSKFL